MRTILSTIAAVMLFSTGVLAQVSEVEKFIQKGTELHDKGDFKGAIAQYEKALEIDKKSPLAHYEISLSRFALKEYAEAIKSADKVLSLKLGYEEEAFLVKGSAQDLNGKPDDAIKTYRKGIKQLPKSYFLQYNLALTLYNNKNYDEAETALEEAITINPNHASSHLMMGLLMSEKGMRVQSCLALYQFLMLEPTGKRAKTAWSVLDKELKKGVKREGSNQINISISGDDDNEFMTAELMLSMLEAGKTVEANAGKTEYQLFAENTKSFFSILGKLKDKHKGFWWDTYVTYFDEMVGQNHWEAFSYKVSQVKGDTPITDWLTANATAVEALTNWSSSYVRN